jgi:hypothetical protein
VQELAQEQALAVLRRAPVLRPEAARPQAQGGVLQPGMGVAVAQWLA